jgi:hypothetical protein
LQWQSLSLLLFNGGCLTFSCWVAGAAFCCSIAPHVVFTLVFLDALPKLQKQIGL